MTVYDQTEAKATRIFISYSSIDRVRTNGLGLLLEAMGHQVFHDHRTIKPGMKWEAALQEGLDEADAVMVFWTRHAARSDWVRKEYEYFLATYPDRILVPVLGDETQLTDILKTRQHADFAPVVNEVLQLKRKMKEGGAGAAEIEQAVVQRLDDAGVEIKSKKQRRQLFLFLGFGWLRTLLRRPQATGEKAGRGLVEKTAQLTAGQIVAIGAAALVGLATPSLIEYASGRDFFPPTPGGSESGDPPGPGPQPGIEAASLLIWGDSLRDFRDRLEYSGDSVFRHLTSISTRLEALHMGGAALSAAPTDDASAEALAQCLANAATLTERIDELEADLPATDDLAPAGQSFQEFTPFTVAPRVRNPERAREIVEEMYPARLEERGVGGTVLVLAFVNDDGSVGEVQLVTSSGEAELDRAAIEAVRLFEYTPGLNREETVSVWIQQKITFGN
jgi:TonB family protein